MSKPFAPSCERNRDAILAVLRDRFAECHCVLEIGSGTGQHACYFASAMAWLTWQASDIAENLPGIRAWLNDPRLPNAPDPIALDVGGEWPSDVFDGVFSANTLHIMSWTEVEMMFEHLPAVLAPTGVLAVYGPFNYGGRFTSSSNAEFNQWLQSRAQHMAIRDFEAVNALAESAGFNLLEDREMPANNRMLVWSRATGRHSLYPVGFR